jgi:hypothetical protein
MRDILTSLTMLPTSVEARANIKVTFLHPPDKSFAVNCRLVSSVGAAAARPAMAASVMKVDFMLKEGLGQKE